MSKKVLVTGGCGFIGSHLVESLVISGFDVTAFDRYNSDSDHYHLANSKLKGEFEVILGDIRDYDSVQNAVKGKQFILHLAALIGIPYSYISPMAYIKTNIEGTYNVLEAARACQTEQVVITSTSETYGSAQYVPIDENHPKVGQSPYSATKIAADQLAYSYFASFDLPVKIVRPFNTYGPRQSSRAIIPNIISQALSNKEIISLGNLLPTRDLTYVADTCDAFIDIMHANTFGQAINIGNGEEISISDLAELICNIIGVDKAIALDDLRVRPENSEVDRLLCDNSKITNLTKWFPKHSLKDGLTETIEWFKANKLHLLEELSSYNV